MKVLNFIKSKVFLYFFCYDWLRDQRQRQMRHYKLLSFLDRKQALSKRSHQLHRRSYLLQQLQQYHQQLHQQGPQYYQQLEQQLTNATQALEMSKHLMVYDDYGGRRRDGWSCICYAIVHICISHYNTNAVVHFKYTHQNTKIEINWRKRNLIFITGKYPICH